MDKKIVGNVDLSKLYLKELPEILKDISVDGHFYCSRNKLTSLSGSPQHVDGGFICSNNSLTSLSGAPQHVGGHFYCYSNSLTSLSGAPQHVGGDFYCNNNGVQFTVAQVRAVCDVKGKIFV